jgi:D-alanyl-D-alanine carboxypeptidase
MPDSRSREERVFAEVIAYKGRETPMRKIMMRLFAWRWPSRTSSKPRSHSIPPRASESPRLLARRQARPEAEVLDSRLLMASGTLAAVHATGVPDLADRVAQVLQPYFTQDQFPGISVAVVTDGQVALAQGYGLSDAATGLRAQSDTRFGIGSVTKTFTAIGVLLLYQESLGTSHPLDLNAPISDYLHNTKSFKLPSKWSQITTMELLNMTSGIRDVGGPLPWQAELKSIANLPLLYTPGTMTSYSDANYDLLGELIEQRTGERYESFIQDQILRPLGMSETQVLGRSATVSNQAVGYDAPKHGQWRKARLQNGPAMYASAGMVSTAEDMAAYMTALLSGRILDPAIYELMWTATPSQQFGAPSSATERGLGWDTVINAGARPTEVAKSGQVPGYNSELILFPSSNSGVYVSFNANDHGNRDPNSVSALQVAESVYEATQSGWSSGG